MRSLRLPRWPILILLAAFFIGPTAGPVRAAPLPVPMAAAATAPAPAVEKAHYGWRRHYWHRHHGWRRHYWHRRHYGWRRHYWHRRHWHHRRPVYFY